MSELRSRARAALRDVDDAKALVNEMMPEGYSPQWMRSKKQLDLLGFRHWLLILVVIGVVYAFVVYQDNRMPNVEPTGQYERFSEPRARILLNELTALGPRVSGSQACEVGAVRLITDRLEAARVEVDRRGVNRFETDIQRPSGCYDLKFLSSFTLCYSKITNIIARIGPKKGAEHSILLNCHFDTLPDCPGATDDAVSCAIMMEVLDILSHSETALQNDIIFLFNGAEENFLQASHGFITQHHWRHSIRAFINLEGSGAGGREILFQAGPGNSWLLQTYLENAPHPHCSVLAQEIFQSGLIPSDTDFRVFRDYGRISGLDIAYFRNGWLYHTEFDLPKYINEGCIQRAGENILALVKALVKSPYLDDLTLFEQGNQWVFYDVIGLFTVFYTVSLGTFLNYSTVVIVFLLIAYRLNKRFYSLRDLLHSFIHHALAAIFMFVVGSLVVLVVIKLDMVMCWYKLPELVFPLYIFPMLLAGCTAYAIMAQRSNMRSGEMVHFDSVLVVFATLLAVMTFFGLASAFFLLIHALFPLMRDPIIYLLGKLRLIDRVSTRCLLFAQLLCTVPVIVFSAYAVMLLFDFFVPMAGRTGTAVNPEFVVMPLSFLTALSFVLYTNNLMYVSRRLDYLMKCGFAIFLFFLLAVATTRLGWPYHYSEASPRLRRLIALDSKRIIHSFGSNASTVENGLFIQALDYRGINDLPEHTFLSGSSKPDCSRIPDEYCRFPYYTAIHELFRPEDSRWIPLPNGPMIPHPLRLELTGKEVTSRNELRMSFLLTGGYDKLSLHITPLNGFTLKQWSLTNIDVEKFGRRSTYFVFWSYGAEALTHRDFWILLENSNERVEETKNVAAVEIAVATHYAHGRYQYSDTLSQLRTLIKSRRLTPHMAVGWWKWAITVIGGVAEIIVHTF
uniref:FXNA-like protease n=1 Tax=Ascaris lumbricoides TaxID=6252 RepID=A0A9J2PCY7_ASCLU